MSAFAKAASIMPTRSRPLDLDLGMKARFPITNSIKYHNLYATAYSSTSTPPSRWYGAALCRHAGQLNLTACPVTQRWKDNWQSTLALGRASGAHRDRLLHERVYTTRPKIRSVAGDCQPRPTNLTADASLNVKSFHQRRQCNGEVRVRRQFTLYMDVLNVADRRASIDATTYGAYLYNPVVSEAAFWASFRVGAR